MATLRNQQNLWSNVAVGAGGVSPAVGIGPRTNVALFVIAGGITTITIECSPGLDQVAGKNNFPDDDQFYSLWKDDGSGAYSIVLAANVGVCIDLSPFAPQYIRLKSSAAQTITAGVDIVG